LTAETTILLSVSSVFFSTRPGKNDAARKKTPAQGDFDGDTS
jgi:hypothetical protein